MAEIIDDTQSYGAEDYSVEAAHYTNNDINTDGVDKGDISFRPGDKHKGPAGKTLENVSGKYPRIEYNGKVYTIKTAQTFGKKAALSMTGPNGLELTITQDDDNEKEAVYVTKAS